jgi:hypothetical protein
MNGHAIAEEIVTAIVTAFFIFSSRGRHVYYGEFVRRSLGSAVGKCFSVVVVALFYISRLTQRLRHIVISRSSGIQYHIFKSVLLFLD